MDRVAEFIEGLRPEFMVPVQTAMLTTVDQAIKKARAVESAYSIGMELSAYSLMPNYMQLLQGGMVPAHTSIAMQPTSVLAMDISIDITINNGQFSIVSIALSIVSIVIDVLQISIKLKWKD